MSKYKSFDEILNDTLDKLEVADRLDEIIDNIIYDKEFRKAFYDLGMYEFEAENKVKNELMYYISHGRF